MAGEYLHVEGCLQAAEAAEGLEELSRRETSEEGDAKDQRDSIPDLSGKDEGRVEEGCLYQT